jgi:hypothetical protein
VLIRREGAWGDRGRFGFRLGGEYQITPPVAGWQPHFQVRLLTGYRPEVRGTFRFAEPFDRFAEPFGRTKHVTPGPRGGRR